MRKMRILLTSLTIAVLIGFSGCSTTEKFSYDTWNKNKSEPMTTEEFTNVFKTYYVSDWKINETATDADIKYDNSEFYEAGFAFWDANDDDVIDQNEWKSINSFYFQKYEFEDFKKIDDNENGELSFTEFREEVEDNGLFTSWDVNDDNAMNEGELAQGVFHSYDFDDSGFLEKGEFNTFASDYAER